MYDNIAVSAGVYCRPDRGQQFTSPFLLLRAGAVSTVAAHCTVGGLLQHILHWSAVNRAYCKEMHDASTLN